jgi:hypothetical protein
MSKSRNVLNFVVQIWRKFRNDSWRLCDIITGYEAWIYHRQIGHKSSNASWVSEGESPTTIVRRSKFEPKNLFCIFFKSNGPVLLHAVDKGKTIDHNYYIENCLKPVVKEIWKQTETSPSKCTKLLKDDCWLHTHLMLLNIWQKKTSI